MTTRDELLKKLFDFDTETLRKAVEFAQKVSDHPQTKSSDQKSISISRDTVLFKYKGSERWHCRTTIRHDDGRKEEVRFKTGTRDFEEAREYAQAHRFKLEGKLEEGFSIKKVKTFESVALEFIERLQESIDNPQIKSKTTHSTYISVLNNHIIPALGTKDIRNITYSDLLRFFNKTEARSPTRIQLQLTAITRVFRLAVEQEYLSDQAVPRLPQKSEIDNINEQEKVVEPFTYDDLILFKQRYSKYLNAAKVTKAYCYKQCFLDYIDFLVLTGVRPGEEALGIRYGDISEKQKDGKRFYTIRIHKGKTQRGAKYRDIAVNHDAIECILNVAQLLTPLEERQNMSFMIAKYPQLHVFKHFETGVPSYDRIFREYLKEIIGELEYENYTVYSTRHTFINNELISKKTPNEIARHCGTSVAMIEKHYEKIKHFLHVDEKALTDKEDVMTRAQRMEEITGYVPKGKNLQKSTEQLKKEFWERVKNG